MDNVRVITIDTGAAQTSVKDLRNELKQLRDTMLSTEKGTDEYNQALLRSAEIQHTLKEQMEEINANAMDFGQIVSNVTKAVGGMVAGFQAAKAVMNLFGVENEEVMKSLQKMQNLMALTQSFSSIDSGIKAFRRLRLSILGATGAVDGFKASLVSTGIGAVILALGLLIANWDKVTDALKRWGIIHEDTAKKLEEQKKKVEEYNTELSKLKTEYADWEKNNKISKLNTEAKKSYEELTNSIKGYEIQLNEISALRNKENLERKAGWKDRWQTYNQEGLVILDTIKKLKDQQEAILANADSYKEADKELEQWLKLQREIAVVTFDLTRSLKPVSLQEELDAKFRNNPIKIPVKIEIDESEILTVEDTKFLAYADDLRKRVEQNLESLRETFKTREEQYYEELHNLELAWNTKMITNEEEYLNIKKKLHKEYTDYVVQQEIKAVQTASQYLMNFGDLFSSIASMQEQETLEGFAAYKNLMYTSTVINTAGGVMNAIVSAFSPMNAWMGIWGQAAMAATSSAAVLAAGIAQAMNISKEQFGGGDLGGTSYTPSTGALNSITAPVQYTQDVQGASIEGAIRSTKVYVTETDITDTQNKVKVTETEARY